jgi:3-dehydroquinate synthetase
MRISAAIDIKASVVAEDPTEVCHALPQSSRPHCDKRPSQMTGVRELLNLGHTVLQPLRIHACFLEALTRAPLQVGHAIEATCPQLLHGECVAAVQHRFRPVVCR